MGSRCGCSSTIPYYKANDPVIAALDAHANVEIRLFNPFTNRRWSRLDFILDFRRVNRRMHNKLMVTDNAAAIVGGRNIGDIYYGVNTIANYRDLDVLAVGPVVHDLSRVFDRYWHSRSTVPIAAIVDRAYGAADLDAILIRLRDEIAAADYPYPIGQDLDNLAARGDELRNNLVWAHGQIIADDPELGCAWRGQRPSGHVHSRASRPAEEGTAHRVALFRAARPGAGNRQGAARAQGPGARADQLARLERHAGGAFRLCQDPQAAARKWHGTVRASPRYRRISVGLVAPFRAVASGLAYQGYGLRP